MLTINVQLVLLRPPEMKGSDIPWSFQRVQIFSRLKMESTNAAPPRQEQNDITQYADAKSPCLVMHVACFLRQEFAFPVVVSATMKTALWHSVELMLSGTTTEEKKETPG